MSKLNRQAPIRWTEQELEQEIESLKGQLYGKPDAGSAGGRFAKAYLSQVLKDRRATLRLLRFQNREANREQPVEDGKELVWPTARPLRQMSNFRPLLQV